VGWHAQNDPRLRLRSVANGARMAHRAVEAHLIDPEASSPRDTDREGVIRLEHEPE